MDASLPRGAHSSLTLLGPVTVVVGGRQLPLGERARTLLATLAVRAGQVVPTAALVDAVWGPEPPRDARHALHAHTSRLRRQCGLPIAGSDRGYLLRVEPGQLDVERFEDLAARGRAETWSDRPDAAVTLLRDALALWRGPALADVPWERFADAEVQRWTELRHVAHEDLVDAELAAGRHLDLAGEIEALVRDQPYRERRWGQLMLALYRSGRQAEALDRYHQLRTLLAAELGIDPSPRLRELEAMILRQDDSLGAEAPDSEPVTRFARGPAGRLAYQVLGDGPRTVVLVPGFGGNVEIRWEEPNLSRLYRRLARHSRLVLMDRRGTGLSDRDTGIPPVEDQVDDLLAVMDAAGVERAAVLGVMDGGVIGLLAAAAHPDRVDAVATYACFAAFARLSEAGVEMFAMVRRQLEAGIFLEGALPVLAPSRVDDAPFTRWLGRYMRMATGFGGAAAEVDMIERIDVQAVLPEIAVPVLAINREHDRLVPPDNAAYIAATVRDGRHVILPGTDSVIWSGDVDAVADQVTAFLTSTRSGSC